MAIVLVGLALVACATQEEIAAQQHETCLAYGFQPETDGYANCRMTLDIERDRRVSTAMQDTQQNLRNVQQDLERQRPVQVVPYTNPYAPLIGR